MLPWNSAFHWASVPSLTGGTSERNQATRAACICCIQNTSPPVNTINTAVIAHWFFEITIICFDSGICSRESQPVSLVICLCRYYGFQRKFRLIFGRRLSLLTACCIATVNALLLQPFVALAKKEGCTLMSVWRTLQHGNCCPKKKRAQICLLKKKRTKASAEMIHQQNIHSAAQVLFPISVSQRDSFVTQHSRIGLRTSAVAIPFMIWGTEMNKFMNSVSWTLQHLNAIISCENCSSLVSIHRSKINLTLWGCDRFGCGVV